MKRVIILLATLLCATAAWSQDFGFNHGPYLQGLTDNAMSVFFTTRDRSFSYVQLQREGSSEIKTCYSVTDGLRKAYDTLWQVRIDGLTADTRYRYRIISKQMRGFKPYKVTFGDSIASDWFDFRTLDPRRRTLSFVVVNDIHNDSVKFDELLSVVPSDSADMVFVVGDAVSSCTEASDAYDSFIDVAVRRFATHKPFAVVRGNHETRGPLARSYSDCVYRPDGHYYALYMAGTTAIVMLDAGEDKPDTAPVYAGLTDFDNYRREQAEWLAGVVASHEFRRAEHRIVLCHIPPFDTTDGKHDSANGEMHGSAGVASLFMPILNRAHIDLMISGHLHKRMFAEVGTVGNTFPIVVNDNRSAVCVEVAPEGIDLRIVDRVGNHTFNARF